jgi:amino acid permease
MHVQVKCPVHRAIHPGSILFISAASASGITAAIGGKIISAGPNGTLLHFNLLGWITIGVSVASLWIFRKVRAVG